MTTPRTLTVTSENQLYQHVDALRRNRETRHRYREFLIEGVRPLNQALHHGWKLTTLLSCLGRARSGWAEGVIARSDTATHAAVLPELWERLCDRDEPGELLAIAEMPQDTLARIPSRRDLCVVVVDRPSSPGNLGALVRSCDAFGAHGVVVFGHAVDVYDPATLRASVGSFFAVPCVRVSSWRDLLDWIDAVATAVGSPQIVGSSARATRVVSGHDFTGPTVLVIGNETWGMSAAFRERCDTIVGIPLVGSASSLNMACAASVLLYEVSRQRGER